jgi:hypothetical protein
MLILLKPALNSVVPIGARSVQVADTTMGAQGGIIINPLSAVDQGLAYTESLWVNLLGDAVTSPANGTSELLPGQAFLVPPYTNVFVTSVSSGHKFTSFFTSNYTVPYPPITTPGQQGTGGSSFPPVDVTGLTDVIPSYLYQEYSDDDDCQGFVAAQNQCQQDYVDTFNALNLPIYTGHPSLVAGALLNWVGAGLYGMARPALSSGQPVIMGPLNTWGPNWIYPNWSTPPSAVQIQFGLNEIEMLSVGDVVTTDDDLYRRILTWHLFKADGNYYSVRWVKRRVWRFVYCQDGQSTDFAWDPLIKGTHPGDFADADDAFIADTSQISVSTGVDQNVTIRFVLGLRTVMGGALLNQFGPNGFEPAAATTPPWDIGSETQGGITLNDLETTYVPYPPLPYMQTFKFALDAGVLEVPYHFNFTCCIG